MTRVPEDELGLRLTALASRIDDSDWLEVVGRADAMAAAAVRPRPRARWRIGFVVAIGVAVAAIVTLFTGGGSVATAPSADAATILRQAAAATSLHGLPGEIPAGRYWYQRTVTHTQGTAPVVIQKWISRAGSGRWRQSGGLHLDATFPGATWAGVRLHGRSGTILSHGLWQPYPITGRGLSYGQMLRLPRDPHRLLRLLGAKVGTPRRLDDLTAFMNVSAMLVQPAVPGPLRAGLYRALALVHSARVLGRATVAGQPAVVIGQRTGRMLQEMFVNPNTGVWLEARILTHASVSGQTVRGTVASTTRLVAAGLVDSTGARLSSIP